MLVDGKYIWVMTFPLIWNLLLNRNIQNSLITLAGHPAITVFDLKL